MCVFLHRISFSSFACTRSSTFAFRDVHPSLVHWIWYFIVVQYNIAFAVLAIVCWVFFLLSIWFIWMRSVTLFFPLRFREISFFFALCAHILFHCTLFVLWKYFHIANWHIGLRQFCGFYFRCRRCRCCGRCFSSFFAYKTFTHTLLYSIKICSLLAAH